MMMNDIPNQLYLNQEFFLIKDVEKAKSRKYYLNFLNMNLFLMPFLSGMENSTVNDMNRLINLFKLVGNKDVPKRWKELKANGLKLFMESLPEGTNVPLQIKMYSKKHYTLHEEVPFEKKVGGNNLCYGKKQLNGLSEYSSIFKDCIYDDYIELIMSVDGCWTDSPPKRYIKDYDLVILKHIDDILFNLGYQTSLFSRELLLEFNDKLTMQMEDKYSTTFTYVKRAKKMIPTQPFVLTSHKNALLEGVNIAPAKRTFKVIKKR
jgi:hypothetical protein